MKMQVYYGDGVFRGGRIDTDSYSALKFRVWHGRPQPGCREYLLDRSGHGKPVYEGCWVLIREAFERNVEGPGGDEFDHNSHAYLLTSVDVQAWFVKHDLTPPTDVIELARHFDGELADDDAPTDGTSPDQPMLSDKLLEVWEALNGRALNAKELAVKLVDDHTAVDVMRQRILAIRRLGFSIAQKRGRGYYRPDSRPPDGT